MRITILGSGYVGLVTAAGLSEMGNHVLCADVNEARVEALRRGKIPFFEPGLSDLVARNVRGRRLSFGSEIEGAHVESDIYFVAVGTPSATEAAPIFATSTRRRRPSPAPSPSPRCWPSRAPCRWAPATK